MQTESEKSLGKIYIISLWQEFGYLNSTPLPRNCIAVARKVSGSPNHISQHARGLLDLFSGINTALIPPAQNKILRFVPHTIFFHELELVLC